MSKSIQQVYMKYSFLLKMKNIECSWNASTHNTINVKERLKECEIDIWWCSMA